MTCPLSGAVRSIGVSSSGSGRAVGRGAFGGGMPGFSGAAGVAPVGGGTPGIHRPGARADAQQKEATQEHGKIRAGLVRHGPDATLHQDGYFCGADCHQHNRNEGNCGEPGGETDEDQGATDNLKATDNRREKIGMGKADLGESSHALGF